MLKNELSYYVKYDMGNIGHRSHVICVEHTDVQWPLCCKTPHDSIFKLCERNADLNLIKTVMHRHPDHINEYASIAVDFDRSDVVDECIKNNMTNIDECLLKATKSFKYSCIKLLIQANATNINECIKHAILSSTISIGDFLITGRVDVNAAFRYACKNNQLDKAQEIVNYGANDFNGALLESFPEIHTQIIKFLLQSGASNLDQAIHRYIDRRYTIQKVFQDCNIDLDKFIYDLIDNNNKVGYKMLGVFQNEDTRINTIKHIINNITELKIPYWDTHITDIICEYADKKLDIPRKEELVVRYTYSRLKQPPNCTMRCRYIDDEIGVYCVNHHYVKVKAKCWWCLMPAVYIDFNARRPSCIRHRYMVRSDYNIYSILYEYQPMKYWNIEYYYPYTKKYAWAELRFKN